MVPLRVWFGPKQLLSPSGGSWALPSHHALCQCQESVSAWLIGSVNSGEWGDDLPPHPSPADGHGKPVPDSCSTPLLISSPGAQWKAHVPVTRRESAYARESGVWLSRCADNEHQTSN
ncbi:hypothetical protein NQZ68_013305 [Dissostichus eleginoides]|nr:hypothetical protein NQZ68_013305 [Dissostichus eleginoides]